MLKILIPQSELYDEVNNIFIKIDARELELEHSLISLSKWESKWKKPFLTNTEQTVAESIDYIKCMTLTPKVDPMLYETIGEKIMHKIRIYIEEPMTATTFPKKNGPNRNREVVTSEIIYYWMIALQIPFECQKWHLNRLLTLINVCNIKNQPAKKMSNREILAENRALNEARLSDLKTQG
jgi:hypothetical protein